MLTFNISKFAVIKFVLWVIIFFSGLALLYHFRWFIPFLLNKRSQLNPGVQMPVLWYTVQILNNLIFLYVGFALIKLFSNFQKTGFFDSGSIRVLNHVIICCITLALLGKVQVVAENFSEVHIYEWKSFESAGNLFFRAFTRFLVFKEPQTMYFLLAIILWAVKQFAVKALIIKNEIEEIV